jgi:hypothetical protein
VRVPLFAELLLTLAYTIYAFLEWSLVLYDVAFDAVATLDFATFQLQIVDVQGEKGYKQRYFLPT